MLIHNADLSAVPNIVLAQLMLLLLIAPLALPETVAAQLMLVTVASTFQHFLGKSV